MRKLDGARWARRTLGGCALACLILGSTGAPGLGSGAVRAADSEQTSPDIRQDVVYGHKDGMALVYDVIQPPRPNGAAVLYMVSGGWFSRWSDPRERVPTFRQLLARGYTVLLVHHGSAPRFKVPDAVEDVRRAVRHVRYTAADLGIDPERIGVLGGSAGGHLALMLGGASDPGSPEDEDPVLRQSDRVQAVVAYYPPVDLLPLVGPSERFPALDFPRGRAADVSPIRFVSADDPPTLLIHGDADELVPLENSRRMHAALERVGVVTDLMVLEGAKHGFREEEYRTRATAAIVDWFERHLRAGPDAGAAAAPATPEDQRP